MIAQWSGGPNDGQYIEIPNGMHEMRVPIAPSLAEMWADAAAELVPTSGMRVLTVPVRRVRVDAIDATGVDRGIWIEARLMWNEGTVSPA